MSFQALFKLVKCWRAPDIVRETVPSSFLLREMEDSKHGTIWPPSYFRLIPTLRRS